VCVRRALEKTKYNKGSMRRFTPKRIKLEHSSLAGLIEFSKTFLRCWICGDHRLLATHEITSGPFRAWGRQHRESWLRLCCVCHEGVIHRRWHCTPLLPREYALKRIRDPKFYNRQLLNEARGRAPDAISADDVKEAHAHVMEAVKW
jgi:hypothetical protein